MPKGVTDMNMQPVLEIIIDTIKNDYKDDIAIFVIMGSHLYQETHSKSDLDMYYIPKTKRGYDLASVFIIDGIGFDLWPISWERIEKIAKHEERIGSIVSEGRVVYYSSDDDLKRFNEMRALANDQSNPGHFIYRSRNQIKTVYQDLYFLDQASSISEVRYYAIQVIYGLTFALALLNQITIKRGRAKLLSEILNMPFVPDAFEEHYLKIFNSKDIKTIQEAIHHLVSSTQTLINDRWYTLIDHSFKDEAQGFYEELINNYNKIERAYHVNDKITSLYAAAEIDHEIDDIISHRGVSLDGLPNLLEAYDPSDLSKIYKRSREHQQKLVEILTLNHVKINVISDLEELKTFLNSRKGE
ncbi:MAG: hypothetical protein C4537_04250 [Acholeplasma sp.]|jgi:hypothetical protein|nr:MAG: hypothetical protein C4537_04250 [Acholeplasma sp.]